MNSISIQLFLTLLVTFAVGVAAAAIWWERRRWQRNPFAQWGVPDADLHNGLEAAPFGVLLFDKHDAMRYSNQFAQRLLDEEGQEALVTDGVEEAGRYSLLTLPSRRTLRRWEYGTSSGRLIVLSDLSSHKQRERQMQEFWGAISHEMRTPLTSMLSHVEAARSAEISPELRDQSLMIMHEQTRRLTQLIHNVLELGKLQASDGMTRHPVDIILIVEQVIASLILIAEGHNIALNFESVSQLPRILGNPDRLKQVFVNLISNAIKYCETGDSITVLLRIDEGGVYCAVSDTGPGIAAKHLPNLTQRFYRVDRKQVGSGLGLAISAEILTQHDSHMRIESQTEGEHTGSTFAFVLPIADD